MTTTAVRLASRYLDASSVLSISRSGRLERALVLSGIMACVMLMAISVTGTAFKGKHVVIHDVDVAFELACAPPEPSFRVVDTLKPLQFEEGQKPAPAATKDFEAPPLPVPEAVSAEKPVVEKKVATHAVPEQAPLAVAKPLLAAVPTPAPPPHVNALISNPFTGSAANAATPAAAASGGSTSGDAGATGSGGTGAGVGQGDPNALAGGDFGIQNGVTIKAPSVAMGNIGPYKKEMVQRLRAVWHPDETYGQITVEVALDHDGKLIDKKIVVSSGSDKVDESLLSALDNTQFAALPDWYRGSQLRIKLKLQNT